MPESEVWIISSKQWPRALIRAELIERGHETVGFPAIAETLARHRNKPSARPGAIILDLNDIEFSWEQMAALIGIGVPTVLLGGSVEIGDPSMAGLAWSIVLVRPFMIEDVVRAVESLLDLGA